MKDRVVCISVKGDLEPGHPIAKIGEIYTIVNVHRRYGDDYYEFEEIPLYCFWSKCFRPVDNSFGEFVEATVMKQAELEEAEKQLV